jgi:hypothetical protein
MKIEKGTKWKGSNYVEFVVTKVEYKDNDTWVFYKENKYTKPDEEVREYNCLAGAFTSRFNPSVA